MRNFQGNVLYEHRHIRRFSNLHYCTFKYVQILCALFILTSSFEISCSKIKTESSSKFILVEILCVLFTLTSHSPATEKKFKPVEVFFQSRE